MTISVHPAYDPAARVWFTDDGVTAKSLAELTRKLPGVRIKGYCPNGYGNVIRPRTPEVTKVTLSDAVRPLPPIKEVQQKPVAASQAKPKPKAGIEPRSSRPVPYRRERSGTRRPSLYPPVDWQLPTNQARLYDLVEEGLSSSQIADKWPLSRSAIIGACDRLGFELKHKRGSEVKSKSSWGV